MAGIGKVIAHLQAGFPALLAFDPAELIVDTLLLLGVIAVPLLLWQRRQSLKSLAAAQQQGFARLRDSEILNGAPDGYYAWSYHPDGTIGEELCSRRLAVLLGLFSGTAAGFSEVLAAFSAAAVTRLDAALTALRQQGDAFAIELPLAEGQRRVLVIGNRAEDADGRVLADILWMRDITEGTSAVDVLTRDNQRLAADRARLAAVLDRIAPPVWLRDSGLSLIYCNKAYAQAVDQPTAEAVLEAGAELLPGSGAREARVLAARARAAGEPKSENFHLVIGGARRLVELTEAPWPNEGGDGLMTVGLALDHTRLEELQNQLDRHVAAHAEVLENLGTAIAIFSSDSRLTFFNAAFAALWRLDSAWLSTQPTYAALLDMLRHERRLPEVADYRAFKAEELRRFTSLLESKEDLLHLPDERTLRRVVSAHPFGGLLFTYEDVTNALALERSHKTSLAVHRETLSHLHEGVAMFASDGRLRLTNPAYARIWDMPPEELAGDPHFSQVIEHHQRFFENDADWPAVRDGLAALFDERIPRHGRIERADGRILDYASVPLPDGAVLVTWMDVSDTAKVERVLRERNEALAAADQLKSEFIANVSAELRTPLNSMMSFAELLAQDYFGDLSQPQQDCVEGITGAGRQLQQVLSDILDLASIEAGQMTLILNAVDVHAMLTAVLRLIRERARAKHIQLEFDCPIDIGWMVADERRIRQVLFNLLSNAVQFTPTRGRVALSARRENTELRFTVTDTGPGIPPEAQDQIFGNFVRRSAAVEEAHGAGLGLALVRNFVELHGGHVEFHSENGEGTAFTLHIPAGVVEG